MQSVSNIKEITVIIVGLFLFILSYILAFGYNYSYFYSFLIIGIFLVLKESFKLKNKKEFLGAKRFIILYLAFFILGIIADLIFGLWITKLWIYPNYRLVNYLLLYFLIYPFGGVIMVYSFALCESIFIKRPRERRLSYKYSIYVSIFLWVFGLVLLFIAIFFIGNYKGFYIYAGIGSSGYGLVNFMILKLKKKNLLERFLTKSFKYGLLIIIVAYTQGILHELPNVFAKEWVYQNFPLNSFTIFRIPALVLFLGWLSLVLIPYSTFELVMELNKLKRFNDLKKFHAPTPVI